MTSPEEWAAKLEAVRQGRMTLGELRGITSKQAHAIAGLGCELAGIGRLEEARVIFAGLVASNPKDATSHAALGTVLQKLGQLRGARIAYDNALTLDATNTVALANRGELRLKSGDRGGYQDLIRSVDADPDGKTMASRRARDLIKVIAQFVET
ncbi:MAG: tetratricopeptide repeat protein [Myxococcaceae bacterium]